MNEQALIILVLLGCCFLITGRSEGQAERSAQGDPLYELLDGFEGQTLGETSVQVEADGETEPSVLSPEKESAWEKAIRLEGEIKLDGSFNYTADPPEKAGTELRRLCKFSLEVAAGLEVMLPGGWRGYVSGSAFHDFVYDDGDGADLSDEFVELYEHDLELEEAYVQGRFNDLYLKIGRQISVWGKANSLRVTDILNPLDLREPGVLDIGEQRMPVTMTRIDYPLAEFNVSAYMVHEIRFDKKPVPGSEYYPLPLSSPQPPEYIPAETLKNTQYGVALDYVGHGWGMSVYAAEFFDHDSQLVLARSNDPSSLESVHSRLRMGGVAMDWAAGNWILKSEAAYFSGFEFLVPHNESFSRLDVMLGCDYAGFRNAMILLEVVNRHLFNFDRRLEDAPVCLKEDELQWALRMQKDFLNSTLHAEALIMGYGATGQRGGFQRISLGYDFADGLTGRIGAINYESGEHPGFQKISDNDRVFFELCYSF